MDIVYESVSSPIANTTLVKGIFNGVHKIYRISPIDGFVLHDSVRDWTELVPDTGERVKKHGFTTGTPSCRGDYDFTANPREFYAVPRADVPDGQIF